LSWLISRTSTFPLLDEAVPSSMGQYSQQHTKTWAAKIDSFDGYVFVKPEYNHAICGALKCNRLHLPRVEQQGSRLCRIRQCRWCARRRASAAGDGGSAGGDCPQSGRPFALHRLRELRQVQAGCAPLEIGEPDARSADCLERRPEAPACYRWVRRIGACHGQCDSTTLGSWLYEPHGVR
jgi:hypothetical protein